MRTFKKPPEICEIVMEGVLIFFKMKYSWKAAQGKLQDVNGFLKNDIIGYDKENISPQIMNTFKKFLEKNKESFNPAIVKEKVSAVEALCKWCLAMKTYSEVSKKVGPKKELVQQLEAKSQVAKQALQEKTDALNLVKQKVALLKKDYDETLKKKQDLETLAELTKARLERASKLTGLLVEEGKRWVITVEELKGQIENITGDVFVSSGCISYCGPFTGVYRNEMTENWKQLMNAQEIPISESFSVVK